MLLTNRIAPIPLGLRRALQRAVRILFEAFEATQKGSCPTRPRAASPDAP
jgi:hypothetical protein